MVMRTAYALASESLPLHSSKFSRKDFTLAQLFACLAIKEHQKRSYRGAEALLRDSPDWLADIGLSMAPDHNTLCRAAKVLLSERRVDRVLDTMARWATGARMLKLSTHPLAVDSTTFDSHHVNAPPAGDERVEKDMWLHEAVAGRDDQQHVQTEPGISAGRQNRVEPPPRHAAPRAHS